MPDILYIVVPCYDEEAVLPETTRRLRAKLTGLINTELISPKSRVLFVNDGSSDGNGKLSSNSMRDIPSSPVCSCAENGMNL